MHFESYLGYVIAAVLFITVVWRRGGTSAHIGTAVDSPIIVRNTGVVRNDYRHGPRKAPPAADKVNWAIGTIAVIVAIVQLVVSLVNG